MTARTLCLAHISTLLGVLTVGCGSTGSTTDSGGATESTTDSSTSSAATTSPTTTPTSSASASGTGTSEGSASVSDSQATTDSLTEGITSSASQTSGPDTTTIGTTTDGGSTTTDGGSTTTDGGSSTTGNDTTSGSTGGSTGGGSTGGSTGGEPLGCGDTLIATIRDFKTPHPDFETYCCGQVTGLVDTKLGNDQKPVFKSVGNPKMLTDAPTFNQWYNDVKDVNQKTQIVLNMMEIMPGLYSYTNNNFFPIDNMLWGNQGNNHNFHFTTRLDTS